MDDLHLDQLHLGFLAVVVEGFHDVSAVVDHAQQTGDRRDQRAGEGDREKDDAEDDVKQILLRVGGTHCRHNRKDNRGGAPQARP